MCEWGSDIEIPNLLTTEGARRTWKIDACIAPIVEALNRGGVDTIASCCGHGHDGGRIDLVDGRVLTLPRGPGRSRGPGGRPQEYDEDTINWNVRFPVSLHIRLREAALERGTSMTRIVQEATAGYLDLLENAPRGLAEWDQL